MSSGARGREDVGRGGRFGWVAVVAFRLVRLGLRRAVVIVDNGKRRTYVKVNSNAGLAGEVLVNGVLQRASLRLSRCGCERESAGRVEVGDVSGLLARQCLGGRRKYLHAPVGCRVLRFDINEWCSRLCCQYDPKRMRKKEHRET